MKREKSKAHSNAGNNQFTTSRSTTPINLSITKEYVNYSSASLSALHHSFGPAAYMLHDCIYFCAYAILIFSCFSQGFLLYGQNLSTWNISYIAAALITIIYILDRGILISPRKESNISIKRLWLWIGVNIGVLLLFVMSFNSSFFAFTLWTLLHWTLLLFIINMPIIMVILISNSSIQQHFPILRGEDEGPRRNNIVSLFVAACSTFSSQYLLSIPHDSTVVERNTSTAQNAHNNEEESASKPESGNLEKFSIKQELLTAEHLLARVISLAIFIMSVIFQSIALVFIAVGGPLLLTKLRRNDQLLLAGTDCFGLIMVSFIVLPVMLIAHSVQSYRVPLKRCLDYIQFLLASYQQEPIDEHSLRLVQFFSFVAQWFATLARLEIRGITSVGQQFSLSLLSVIVALILGVFITILVCVVGGSWRFQSVAIPLAIILVLTLLLLLKFAKEDFSRQQQNHKIIPHDLIATGQNQKGQYPQIDDDQQTRKAAAKILGDVAFIEKVESYKEFCGVFNESAFAQSELLQTQAASDISSPVSAFRGTAKQDRRKDLQRKNSK